MGSAFKLVNSVNDRSSRAAASVVLLHGGRHSLKTVDIVTGRHLVFLAYKSTHNCQEV